MTAAVSFKELLSSMAARLGEAGFHRKGNSFYLREGNNWGIVNFQKSTKSTANLILFTVNVGTASGKLLDFAGLRTAEVPRIDQCHWRKRLGFFSQDPSDTWWRIDMLTSPSAVAKEIVDALLKQALPVMKVYMLDASLVELWTSGDSPGLTEMERLKYLAILLKLEGSVDALKSATERLERMSEGRPSANAVASHLRRLNNMHNA
jgi:hypothetical protein